MSEAPTTLDLPANHPVLTAENVDFTSLSEQIKDLGEGESISVEGLDIQTPVIIKITPETPGCDECCQLDVHKKENNEYSFSMFFNPSWKSQLKRLLPSQDLADVTPLAEPMDVPPEIIELFPTPTLQPQTVRAEARVRFAAAVVVALSFALPLPSTIPPDRFTTGQLSSKT